MLENCWRSPIKKKKMSFKKILLPNKQTKNPCYILEGGGTQHGTRTFSQLRHHHTKKHLSSFIFLSLSAQNIFLFPLVFRLESWTMEFTIHEQMKEKWRKASGTIPQVPNTFLFTPFLEFRGDVCVKINWSVKSLLANKQHTLQRPHGPPTPNFSCLV